MISCNYEVQKPTVGVGINGPSILLELEVLVAFVLVPLRLFYAVLRFVLVVFQRLKPFG